ncbi:MAG: hypothetical protein DME20_07725 [Verrucomicrobia bacterium]|nr:MAG: hypothetical protein DME20_07725 [Verrucomicrobiota bacterium]
MGIRIAVRSVKTVLALALLLAGCNSKKENEWPADEVIEQTYKVNADATLRITNPRGSVAIRGEDTPEVRMRAVKSVSSAAQLKDITVDVTAEPADILIKTAFLRQKKMPLLAVANGGLDIIYGRCVGSYFSADAQILNGNARLSIARGAALRVHCETVNGKITNNLDPTVELNEQSSRKIDLSLGTGRRSDLTVRATSGDITVVAAEPGG